MDQSQLGGLLSQLERGLKGARRGWDPVGSGWELAGSVNQLKENKHFVDSNEIVLWF